MPRFVAYDDYDQVKENHHYVDLMQAQVTPNKPTEFTLSWQGGYKETYWSDTRNQIISLLLKLVEDVRKVKVPRYRAAELCRSFGVRLDSF